VIRRTAQIGDWVVGVGSRRVKDKDYSGRLVYAMKITDIKTLKEYDTFCTNKLPKKIPDLDHKDYRRKVGDCQYDYSEEYAWQRPGVHRKKNRAKDLRGENSLLSKHFYYFGSKARKIPARFSVLCRQGQGHQLQKNEKIKEAFIKWLERSFEKNKLYGEPQVQVRLLKDTKGNPCATIRCSTAEEDEKWYKKNGDC